MARKKARRKFALLVALAPASRAKNFLLRRCGWNVDPRARVGPVLMHRVAAATLGPGSRIGPFNVFRDIEELVLERDAVIGQWNWISASRELVAAGGTARLAMGESSALTSRHYVDASGGVTIGRFTTVAGVRSTFITHGIDWTTSKQRTRPITIGEYCLIGSNATVAPGTSVPDRVVVGMGSTLRGRLPSENAIYHGGSVPVANVGLEGEYFTRAIGFVAPDVDD